MELTSETFLDMALPKIEELKSQGKTYTGWFTLWFGYDYKKHTDEIEKKFKELDYDYQIKPCRKKLVDILVWF